LQFLLDRDGYGKSLEVALWELSQLFSSDPKSIHEFLALKEEEALTKFLKLIGTDRPNKQFASTSVSFGIPHVLIQFACRLHGLRAVQEETCGAGLPEPRRRLLVPPKYCQHRGAHRHPHVHAC
jgi:hypothetical protein